MKLFLLLFFVPSIALSQVSPIIYGVDGSDDPCAYNLITGACLTEGGAGTVTSVGLALPDIFSVSGSPVISSGTLTGTLETQTANTCFAGPASGSAATPAFRALVNADIPGKLLLANGSATDPTYSFLNDTNTGMYSIGSDEMALVAGGKAAFDLQLATSANFSNVGLGGPASLSDSFPLLIQRDLNAQLVFQISNPNTGDQSASRFELLADAGNNYFDISVFPASSTLDAYSGRGVLRPNGSTKGLSLIGGDDTPGDVRIYTGGYAAGNRRMTILSDGGVIVGAPTAGSQGAGTINATGVYDDGVLLTCPALQPEFLKSEEVNLDKWDAKVPKRAGKIHLMAHLLKNMVKEGFDPRDVDQYLEKMEKDHALPGMPKESDWVQNSLSLGEITNRKWLAMELLALALRDMRAKQKSLEARVEALEHE